MSEQNYVLPYSQIIYLNLVLITYINKILILPEFIKIIETNIKLINLLKKLFVKIEFIFF